MTAGSRGAPARISGVVLAGGRSSRFGSDKMAVLVGGVPLLHRPLRSLAEVCVEVVLVLAPGAPEPVLPQLRVPVRLTRDAEPYGGPLHGIAAGLEAVAEPVALLAAGDMPDLRPALLRLLIGALGEADAPVAALASTDAEAEAFARAGGLDLRMADPPHVFPSAVRVPEARRRVRALLASGERRARAIVLGPGVSWVPARTWRSVDRAAGWTRDIDRPEDVGA